MLKEFLKRRPLFSCFMVLFIIFFIFLLTVVGVFQTLLIVEPIKPGVMIYLFLVSFWWALCGALTIKYWGRKKIEEKKNSHPTA